MELIFRTNFFEMCICTKSMYCFAHDDMLPPMFTIRFGRYVWRMGKGWRDWKAS